MKPIMITLDKIRKHNPCSNGWEKVLEANGGELADYEKEFKLSSYLDSNGLNDTLWVFECLPEYNDLWCKYACWCALLHIEKIKPYCSKSEYNCILKYLKNPTAAAAAEAEAATWVVKAEVEAAATTRASWAARAAAAAAARAARAAWAARAAAWAVKTVVEAEVEAEVEAAEAEAAEAATWAAKAAVRAGAESTLIFTKLRQIIELGEWVEDD